MNVARQWWGRSLARYDDGLQKANLYGFADSLHARMKRFWSGQIEKPVGTAP